MKIRSGVWIRNPFHVVVATRRPRHPSGRPKGFSSPRIQWNVGPVFDWNRDEEIQERGILLRVPSAAPTAISWTERGIRNISGVCMLV